LERTDLGGWDGCGVGHGDEHAGGENGYQSVLHLLFFVFPVVPGTVDVGCVTDRARFKTQGLSVDISRSQE
jgi:hypothetical protein